MAAYDLGYKNGSVNYELEHCPACKNIADLQEALAENAELRELVADMLHDAMENVCSKSYWCEEKSWQTCNDKSCGSRLYVEMARKLGIEVDDGTE